MPIRMAPRVSRLLPLAAVVLWAVAVPASAQQAEEPSELQQLLGKMGILYIPSGPPIDYRERAPLVVPPSSQLITPRGLDDIKKINPDWPLDPDLERYRAAAAAKEKGLWGKRDESLYGGRVSPDELKRGTISKSDGDKRRSEYSTGGEELAMGKERYTPEQLGFKGWFSKGSEKPVEFTAEPERRNLTEPPSGYRTPSPNAPYGVVDKKKEEYKPSTLTDRVSKQTGTEK